MKKRAFVSALGGMGRRHAIALAKLGFDVVSVEPDIRCLNEFKKLASD